jgi:metallo-beta-lactamase family protein
MLADSAHIQEKDAEWVNRRHRKKGAKKVEPLYDKDDAARVLSAFVDVEYGVPFNPAPGLTVVYRDAGHILGSASMVLTIEEDGRTVKLGFTGDVGRGGRPILRDPEPMDQCDYLISESTYGGRTHEPSDQAKDRLANVIGATARRGGKVIIPAFAVGRTQEIVFRLDELTNEGRLPPIPVYVDSPLAVNVTDIFRKHPECFDDQMLLYMKSDAEPFGFSRLRYVRDVSESKALNTATHPMVVISASGMCEAGRVLHHLRNSVEDPKNTVMIVGFCAPHTLGRRIVERKRDIKIFGEPYRLRAEVEVMNAYSAHADEPELVNFIAHLDPTRLKKIFLVHGDPERQVSLFGALRARGYVHAHGPIRGEVVDL